jgi:DNA mismatch repair protein MutL
MASISMLPMTLVNKIAAGEVIERPSSVLKELMENSLDAGAGRVSVELEDGGKKLIRVVDNGCGMTKDDLALACLAHATSKLKTEDDLYAIGTLGFRGEALASVAAVSQLEILSRPADQIEGGRLAVTAGQVEPVTPAAAPVGTSITARNLFFNTPARRKFLRTTNTELGHITEQFIRIALANTAAQMILEHNGRRLYDLPADQSLLERIAALFGNELADGLIAIRPDTRYAHIGGFIAPPRHSRASAQGQYIFLNGRYIRDRFISHAVREAYRGLMEASRQPVVFLFITLDPHEVDVNVHPTKIEVRFANSNLIHSQVLAAIRDRLLSTDLTPAGTITAAVSSLPAQAPAGQADAAPENQQSAIINQIGNPALDDQSNSPNRPAGQADSQRQERVRQAVADFFKSAKSSGASLGDQRTEPRWPGRDISPPCENTPSPVSTPPADALPESDIDRFLQIHNQYVVVQQTDGILIIDQHALHERIIYEQLFEQFSRGPLETQRRLIPETIEAGPQQMAAVENASDLLKQLGILLEPFGPRTLAVQGYPPILDKLPVAQFTSDLLDLLVEHSDRVSREELVHRVLDMIACKAAVKAGDPLNEQEIKSLLSQRDRVERSSNCPHGRPTTLKLTLSQLEKQFKRT